MPLHLLEPPHSENFVNHIQKLGINLDLPILGQDLLAHRLVCDQNNNIILIHFEALQQEIEEYLEDIAVFLLEHHAVFFQEDQTKADGHLRQQTVGLDDADEVDDCSDVLALVDQLLGPGHVLVDEPLPQNLLQDLNFLGVDGPDF